jgi:chromosome segregation ATPase
MKVLTYCYYFLLALLVLTTLKSYTSYLTSKAEYRLVQEKLKSYQQLLPVIQDARNRASGTFNTLKNQRSSLKQQIQQAVTTYRSNISDIDSQINARRADLDSALNMLYLGASMTDDERAEAVQIRKDTLEKTDQQIQQAVKNLKALEAAQPGPITD